MQQGHVIRLVLHLYSTLMQHLFVIYHLYIRIEDVELGLVLDTMVNQMRYLDIGMVLLLLFRVMYVFFKIKL